MRKLNILAALIIIALLEIMQFGPAILLERDWPVPRRAASIHPPVAAASPGNKEARHG
jgi:hypothetical protein